MNHPAQPLADVAELNPREAAATLAAAYQDQLSWLDEFAEQLDRHRAGQSLVRTLAVWDVNQSQAAGFFGVSRQAVSKWMEQGVPADRAQAIADLAAATDVLIHYLKRDRIPAVVRRPIPGLENQSLLDLLAGGHTEVLLNACRDMFSFDQV